MKFKLFVNHELAPKLERGRIALLVRQIIRDEKKKADNINVVLVNDDYILDVNQKFLNHNYKTDVISFDLSENEKIDGEVYVSVDRAKAQAGRYKVSLEMEILRLIVHGILHLTGLNDKTRSEKLRMRKRENVFIQQFYSVHSKG
ncbi:MAG: rRNA maturation RNase YbeY [Candidatus Kryptoniota bacterium]